MKKEILSLLPEEIENYIAEMGFEKYRAAQIFGWLHKKNVASFEEMGNLPGALICQLEEKFFIPQISVVREQVSEKDGTKKFLTLVNDTHVESVLMEYKHGNSVCISTQAGCKMGCVFCASAHEFHRNLTAGEYCLQVYNALPVKNIVLMGCGEPLDNFGATLRFLELISHPDGKNIGQRHMTLSTCGLVPEIYELAEQKLQITLAISLHAPTDEIREKLMPIAKAYPIEELMAACRRYVNVTHRRLTFEYALAKDINDSPSHAKLLSKLLQRLLCHVNLIPMNSRPVLKPHSDDGAANFPLETSNASGKFSPSSRRAVENFADVLRQNKIPVSIRRSLGGGIDAACGQLRSKNLCR